MRRSSSSQPWRGAFEFEALPQPPVVAQPALTLRQQFGLPMTVTRRR